jgi:hypothetical protein
LTNNFDIKERLKKKKKKFKNNFDNPISNDQKLCFQNIAWPTNCRLKKNKAECR